MRTETRESTHQGGKMTLLTMCGPFQGYIQYTPTYPLLFHTFKHFSFVNITVSFLSFLLFYCYYTPETFVQELFLFQKPWSKFWCEMVCSNINNNSNNILPPLLQYIFQLPAAKFIVPYWGIKSTRAWGCRTEPPSFVAWWAGTTTQCHSQLYPPSQGLWIGPLFARRSRQRINIETKTN